MSPDMIALWYKENNYNFISFTEHNTLQNDGQKYVEVKPGKDLTPERLEEIQKRMGPGWVQIIQTASGPRMVLKTHEQLRARFNEPQKFLLISGEEITTARQGPHMTALNLKEAIPPTTGEPATIIQNYLDAVKNQSKRLGIPIVSHLNHPHYQNGIPAEELMKVRGLRGLEIYSFAAEFYGNVEIGRPRMDRYWDILLSMKQETEPGEPLYAFATDDSHDFYKVHPKKAIPGRAWIVVRANQLEERALAESMLRGDFYASTGVALNDIEVGEKELKISIDQEPGVTYTVQFIGTKIGFDRTSTPAIGEKGEELVNSTRNYSSEIGQVLFETTLNPAVYSFQGNELYVRAFIVSSKPAKYPLQTGEKEMAWVQPVMLKRSMASRSPRADNQRVPYGWILRYPEHNRNPEEHRSHRFPMEFANELWRVVRVWLPKNL